MAAFDITSFSVIDLYGNTTITVPISDNRLVLVGPNGIGKSTCLNMLCYFISRQWHRLLDYEFRELSITINSERISLAKSDLALGPKTLAVPREDLYRLPVRARNVIDAMQRTRPDLMAQLFTRSMPLIMVRDELRLSGIIANTDDLLNARRYIKPTINIEEQDPKVASVTQFLEEAISDASILYLPTYRRIEKDLAQILPDLEDELRQYRRRVSSESDTPYLELVEFGMEDVSRTFDQRLTQLKDAARFQLGSLASVYLRDVLRNQGDQFDPALVSRLSDAEVNDVLARFNLGSDERTLREVIGKIRNGDELEPSQRYVAHFFVQLLQAWQTLQASAVPITQFVNVCNQYLQGKQLIYDDNAYNITVMKDQHELSLAVLSSGEKQIVSLFAQVYMEPKPPYIIVIDEPELSLSLEWQRRLLPDLSESKRCAFIAAATHSPFIFENEFDSYTIDLSDCVVVRGHERVSKKS